MPENINPPIGSRSTCRECGQEVRLFAGEWYHHYDWQEYPMKQAHPAVPIDHAEPVKTNAELLELAAKNPPPSEYFEGYMPNPFTEPSPADARTVEELVGKIRNGIIKNYSHATSCGCHDCRASNEARSALDELARRLGVTHV